MNMPPITKNLIIINLLFFLAKMGAKSAPLIDLFDSKLAKKLGDFQDEVGQRGE